VLPLFTEFKIYGILKYDAKLPFDSHHDIVFYYQMLVPMYNCHILLF
jgi:hypothetical protein